MWQRSRCDCSCRLWKLAGTTCRVDVAGAVTAALAGNAGAKAKEGRPRLPALAGATCRVDVAGAVTAALAGNAGVKAKEGRPYLSARLPARHRRWTGTK